MKRVWQGHALGSTYSLELDAVRQLDALGAVPSLDPGFAQKLAEQCGVRWDRAEVVRMIPLTQKP